MGAGRDCSAGDQQYFKIKPASDNYRNVANNWGDSIISFSGARSGAHLSGFVASWTKYSAGYTDKPWIPSSSVGLKSTIGKIFGLVGLAAMCVLVSSGIGLLLN